MSAYLTDHDRPHLSGLASLIPQANGVVVHDTRTGASFVLTAADAQVVRSCNGLVTVAELVSQYGPRAQHVLGQLLAAGLLSNEVATLPAEVTITAEHSDDAEVRTITALPPGAALIISAPTVAARPSLQVLPKGPLRSPPAQPPPAALEPPRRPTREPLPLGKGGSVAGVPSPIPPGLEWPPDPISEESRPDVREPLTKPEGRRADLLIRLKPTPAERAKGIAPWALLGLVVIGGSAYHLTTVAALKARAAEERKVLAAPTPPQRMVRLQAKDVLEVTSSVGGVPVKRVAVTKGQLVKKNATLVELEDGKARAELQEAVARSREASRQRPKNPARIEAAAAEVKRLQEQLDEYKLRSPIDGTVMELNVKQGETPPAGALVRVADLSQLIIDLDVREADARNLVAGAKAEVLPQDGEGKPAPATVVGLTTAAGVAVVRVQLKANEAWLKPDTLVTVTFPQPQTPGTVEASAK